MGEMVPPSAQRKADGGKIGVGLTLEPGMVSFDRDPQCAIRVRRQGEQMKLRPVSRGVRGETRRLLEHHESIRSAKAERIDRGEPRTIRWPLMALGVNEKRAGREVDFRVRS